MAPRKKPVAPAPSVADLQAEITRLRGQVDIQTQAAQLHQERLATAMPAHRAPFSELMVGVRNISDVNIGLPPLFPGDAVVTLLADLGVDIPKQRAVISYARWQEVRQSSFMGKGLLVRDDAILGATYTAGPADRAEDIPASWAINAIPDPVAWIEARTDLEIKQDIAAMTSEHGWRRLQRIVSQEIARIQATHPKAGSVQSAVWALGEVSSKYQLVDSLTVMRIEKGTGQAEDESEEEPVHMPGQKLRIRHN